MQIRNELTRELDRYNGTKLKGMYKLTKIFTSWLTEIWYKLMDQDRYDTDG